MNMNRATPTTTLPNTRHTLRRLLALLLVFALVWAAHPAAAQDGRTTHTVQAGENLYRIALHYGLTVDQLVTANAISDPTRIYTGQVLTIPLTEDTSTTDSEPALHSAAVNPAPDMSAYHVVMPGETLTSIAQQYGTNWQTLLAANGLGDPSVIVTGQKLLVPDMGTGGSLTSDTTDNNTASTAASGSSDDDDPAQAIQADIPDQVAAINPQPVDDLGILAPDAYPTPASDQRQPVVAADVPDQVLALNPPTEVEDLGIISPAPDAAVNPAPAAQDIGIVQTQPQQQTNTSPVAVASTASGERTHRVQAGEHLASIAARYGLSYPTLAMANNITNPDQIYSGQQLIIPAQDYAPASYVPQSTAPPAAAAPTITDGKQVVVDLSDQRVYAYENGQLLRNALVSTGTAAFPTVQGNYKVYLKYESQTMSGPGYNLPGVPYVLYFYKGYSLHGTYWHDNFGTPMSHGCVNMYTPDAQWLWNWAPIGTPVRVQW